MKWSRKIPILFLLASAPAVFAAFSDFDFKAEPKCQDKEVKTKNDLTKQEEQWAYDVVGENKSARDYANVEIRYVIFKKAAMVGAKLGGNKIVRKEGSTTVPEIKAHGRYSFTTEPVTLKKTQLAAGWTYTNGASARTYDSLQGIWIKVFVGGLQVGEFTAPQGLESREKWDAPKK